MQLKIKLPTQKVKDIVYEKWNYEKFQNKNPTLGSQLVIDRLGIIYAMLLEHVDSTVELDEELYIFITN
jgi:predicted outer membrane lipoprotein